MQPTRSALVPLLLATLCAPAIAAAPKVHSVTLGPARKATYTPPGSTAELPLKLRTLVVDGRQKEWVAGDLHDVTDRSFAIRRVLRVNDALATEPPRWIWQPGPWLLVDRTTGHITPLHLPDFDAALSEVTWFRDYAAYCGIATTAKGGLYAVVTQLGVRKPIVAKQISKTPESHDPPCAPADWQRKPLTVTLHPTGQPPLTFEVTGTTSALIEEGDNSDEPN